MNAVKIANDTSTQKFKLKLLCGSLETKDVGFYVDSVMYQKDLIHLLQAVCSALQPGRKELSKHELLECCTFEDSDGDVLPPGTALRHLPEKFIVVRFSDAAAFQSIARGCVAEKV